jgi:hypothetical protein
MIKKVLEDCLKMSYYKNYAATSGAVHNISKHEDAVEDIIQKYNFNKLERKVTKDERDLWMEDSTACDLPDNCYVTQPCGTHNSPDFIVKENGKLYFLECKSVSKKTKAPMYNGGIPKSSYIYIFSAERYDKTTIYFGHNVLPPEDYSLLQECIAKHREIDKKYNKLFTNLFGIRHYTRPMLTHIGGTDYFDNPYRKEIEQGVIDFVS